MIRAACKELLEIESQAVGKARKKLGKSQDAEAMDAWLNGFAAHHRDRVMTTFEPIVDAYCQITGEQRPGRAVFLSEAWTLNMCCGIRTALDSGDFGAASRLNALDNQAAWVTRMLLGDRDDEKPNA